MRIYPALEWRERWISGYLPPPPHFHSVSHRLTTLEEYLRLLECFSVKFRSFEDRSQKEKFDRKAPMCLRVENDEEVANEGERLCEGD